jgi:hypothetical protein
MAYSKAKLKSNGHKASPYFRPSDKCLPTNILLYVSFKHILIIQNCWISGLPIARNSKYKKTTFQKLDLFSSSGEGGRTPTLWDNLCQSNVTTDSQSVCLSVKFMLELVTRYYFLFESCCVVSVMRLL